MMNNKFIKIFLTIFRVLFWIVVIMILGVIIMQKVFDNKIAFKNILIFTVATGSMLPEYKIGDVIIVGQKDYDKIEVGDDLVYEGKVASYKDKIITHRVISINYNGKNYDYTTQGINNPEPDPIVNQSQVYGVVKYKPITLSIISHILLNSFGFYFLVFVPIAFLVFLETLDFIKSKEEKINNEGV